MHLRGSALSWLVKKAAADLAPVLCLMGNASLQSGKLPASQKHAIVLLRLKKPTLDEADLNITHTDRYQT